MWAHLLGEALCGGGLAGVGAAEEVCYVDVCISGGLRLLQLELLQHPTCTVCGACEVFIWRSVHVGLQTCCSRRCCKPMAWAACGV